MANEFNLRELTARAFFDYVGPQFPAWFQANKARFVLPSLKNISEQKSKGGQYFMTLKVSDKNGAETLFPNEPLVSFDLAKTIIETPTVGQSRKGTVKEYITTEDWQITIQGLCINTEDSDLYPSQQVEELNRLFQKNEALEVQSNKLFSLFGINNIVLKDISFDPMPGQEGIQKYEIKAVSDQDFFAELDEKKKNRQNLLNG